MSKLVVPSQCSTTHPYNINPIDPVVAMLQSGQMPKRILVVDDSAAVVNSVKFILESVPDWVVGGEASNGLEAIDKVALLNPDLVVLDLSMPIMNGLDAARELSRIRPDLPVVMFTDSPEIAREALLCGCREVISKTKVLLLISVIHDIFARVA